MDWIFDHFQIVVLIAVVIGSLVKRYFEAKVAEREARDEMPDEGEIFDAGEAWQPPESPPQPSVPPPLVWQASPPPLRDVPAQHSREFEAELILKRQREMQDRIRQIKESKATTSGGASATRTRVAAEQSNAKPVVAAKAGLRQALRNPAEVRRAVVMREILGPPLGLR